MAHPQRLPVRGWSLQMDNDLITAMCLYAGLLAVNDGDARFGRVGAGGWNQVMHEMVNRGHTGLSAHQVQSV